MNVNIHKLPIFNSNCVKHGQNSGMSLKVCIRKSEKEFGKSLVRRCALFLYNCSDSSL